MVSEFITVLYTKITPHNQVLITELIQKGESSSALKYQLSLGGIAKEFILLSESLAKDNPESEVFFFLFNF